MARGKQGHPLRTSDLAANIFQVILTPHKIILDFMLARTRKTIFKINSKKKKSLAYFEGGEGAV